MNNLVDTTEMYLRTIYDLEEEDVVPLRARIAERLKQSGPTVSQTVARMQRDGLLITGNDKHLQLSEHGRLLAIRVTRKHRLAELLLYDILKLDWDKIHAEACRWEHVMSEQAESRIYETLGNPTASPYGNPIPGLAELDFNYKEPAEVKYLRLIDIAAEQPTKVIIKQLTEHAQEYKKVISNLLQAGVLPGNKLICTRKSDYISLQSANHPGIELDYDISQAIRIKIVK